MLEQGNKYMYSSWKNICIAHFQKLLILDCFMSIDHSHALMNRIRFITMAI